MRVDVAAVREAARGRWFEILTSLAPVLRDAVGRHPKHGPCPVHGGKDGFRLYRDANETGGGICNTCGARSDGFAMLQWVNGWDFADTLSSVATHLNIFLAIPDDAPARPGAEERMWQIWREAQRDNGRISAYLASRGLSGVVPASLRLHPSLPYYDDKQRLVGSFPTMVAPVQTSLGEVVALHRTYLSHDGPGKAPVPMPKKLTPAVRPGATNGAAIRLAPVQRVINIAEGIETAIAVMENAGGSALATVSAGGLVRFMPPDGVREVHIWADNDEASGTGQKASAIALRNLRLAGYVVYVHIAISRGKDWLEVYGDA